MLNDLPVIPDFERESLTADNTTHDVYVIGAGAPLLLMHELPGLAQPAINLARRLAGDGFRVYLPHLFGTCLTYQPGHNYLRLCISKEFASLRAGVEAPITRWLRSLADRISTQNGGGSVGVIGMCVTGAFVIPLILDPAVKAAVAAQPAIPFSFRRVLFGVGTGPWASQLNVPDEQVTAAASRAQADSIPLLAMRFKADRVCVHEKIERLRGAFGAQVECHELEGTNASTTHRPPHAILTEEYDSGNAAAILAYGQVIQFLHQHL